MGRFLSSPVKLKIDSSFDKLRVAGLLPDFGQGMYKCFLKSGTFVVPENVTSIRVRVVGGGGSGGFTGTEDGVQGGTSSFGNLISATGGQGGMSHDHSGTAAGGVGIGGDFQASGGSVTKNSSVKGCGGGAAGSQLGDGGTTFSYGGAGVGGGDSYGKYGGSAFGIADISNPGQSCSGYSPIATAYGAPNSDAAANAAEHLPCRRFPFEFFTGAGGFIVDGLAADGGVFAVPGGSGAGGAFYANRIGSKGGDGGGGGACGTGGIGGGGGGYVDANYLGGGGAGGGYAHGVFSVVPGTSYAVTVAAIQNVINPGGPGLVVVEW